MLLFTLPIAIVIGVLIARNYAPKNKSEKIWASILIPLISGVVINLLIASCMDMRWGFWFNVGRTLLFVAIPEVALLITLFVALEVGGKKNWNDISTMKLHYGTGENRVDFEVSLTQKEILQMAKLREQDPERWKDNELELVKMVKKKKEMAVIQLEKEEHMDKQEETIDENVEKVEEPIENQTQTTNNESEREEKIVEKTKTEEMDNEAVSGVKTNKKKYDNKLSKWPKVLLIAILSLGLLFGFGILASFVYTKYIYPAHAKAEDEKLIQEAIINPSKAYKIAQELFKKEQNGHQSEYHGFFTGKQGVCNFNHKKAGMDVANIYCQYCMDSASKDISKSAYIARDMLFQKNDGFCDSLYNKTGVEILKYGAEQGDAKAQFALGCYYGGCEYNKADGGWNEYCTLDGNAIDHAKSAYWYLQSANQGFAIAMGNLGNCYMYGEGVAKNEKKGLELIQKAAELGDAFYQCRLGDYYRDGVKMKVGSHKEIQKAVYGKAYRSEDKVREYWDDSKMEWVKYYQVEVADYKIILPRDMKQAQYWWKKAADNGDETAKERLQQIYE